MAEKIKKNLAFVICAAAGVLNFIWFAIPYVTGMNAYDIMSWGFDIGTFGFIMAAIIQIFALIGTLAMLGIGVVGIILIAINKTVNFDLKKIAKLALAIMAALSVLMLVFVIIAIEGFDGISAGVFVWLVVSVGAFVADYILDKKFA